MIAPKPGPPTCDHCANSPLDGEDGLCAGCRGYFERMRARQTTTDTELEASIEKLAVEVTAAEIRCREGWRAMVKLEFPDAARLLTELRRRR